MMLVHSREDFERVVNFVGFQIVEVRGCTFFGNDPKGLDASEEDLRIKFNNIRTAMNQFLAEIEDKEKQESAINVFVSMELALLDFCQKRIKDIDLPSQKLVVLSSKQTPDF